MKKNLMGWIGCGAVAAVCLTGSYLHVKYNRMVEVGSEDMGKVFVHNIEYVMKCKTLGNVSKEDYEWYFENVYRFKFLLKDGQMHHATKESISNYQQKVNDFILEMNPLIPDSFYIKTCNIWMNEAQSNMDITLEKNDVVYRYFGKY